MTTQITPLPDPPLRSDPTNFPARADAFMAALPTFATEANALATTVNAQHDAVVTSAQAAFNAGLSSAAANAATATAKATSAADSASLAQAAWTAALAANPDLNPVVRMNPSTITVDTTIPSGYNAYSAGPLLTIAEGVTVTINDFSHWSII